MKVIHLIGGGDAGGAKTHVFTLLQGLSTKIQVKLVPFREGEFAQEARALGLDVEVIADKNPLRAYEKLKGIITEEGFDIVHCHGARGNMMGAMVHRNLKLPVVTTVHSDYRLDYLGRPLGMLTYGVINMAALRCLDYYIGVSDPVSNMLVDRGFPADKLFTIYNGLNFDAEKRAFDRREFLSRCGLELAPGDVVAGIAARLSPVKDIPTLLKAVARASKTDGRLKLLVAGDGESAQALKEMARELGIEDRVCFAGWVRDMDAFYRSIDINLLTSLSETFPYVLTEGARLKRATIASRVGGVPVLIDNGVNGLLFDPGDVETLSRHLVALTQDELMRRRFGTRLLEKAARLFSLDHMVDHQLEIYETILRRFLRPRNGRDGVTICGAYGRGNAGDDAILEAVLRELRDLDPDMPLRVLSRNPRETRRIYRVPTQYTFNPISLWFSLRKSKMYLNGGGNLIQNATSQRSLFFYLHTLKMGRLAGCKVMMYACGIGPVVGKSARRKTARVINRCADVVTLRENHSLQELKNIGVRLPRVVMTADPALNLPPAGDDQVESFLLSHDIPLKKDYICFCLRPWPGFREKAEIFGRAANYAYETYGLTPLFLPIEAGKDVRAAQMVLKDVYCPYEIITEGCPARVTIGILSRMKVVVSMRLHALIFASGQGIPLVGAVYDEKVSAFLRYIGQNLFQELEEVEYDSLCALIDRAVKLGENPEAQCRAVERLRELESRNVELLRELLK